MHLYSRKVPERKTSKQFVDCVCHKISAGSRQERKADDFQKAKFSYREWSQTSQETTSLLEEKVKEPTELLFFKVLYMNAYTMIKENAPVTIKWHCCMMCKCRKISTIDVQ
eukprot:2436558-Ditylum_brightwellii.AAC.1